MDPNAWVSISRRRANLTAVVTTALLIGSLFLADHGALERAAFARRTGMLMIALHGFLHGLSIYGLRAMVLRRVENAELALALYLHPRRVSHLDLAAVWGATYAAAPYVL